MKSYNVVIKDGKYLTASMNFTTNENLAYTFATKEEAQKIAKQVGGEAKELKVGSYLK